MPTLTPPEISISFRNMDRSDAAAARIEAEARKLTRYRRDILSCHAVMEARHRHHRFGHHYQLHLELKVPGRTVAVSHEPAAPAGAADGRTAKRTEIDVPHKDPYVVIRDAFNIARRRLEESLHRDRGVRRTGAGCDQW